MDLILLCIVGNAIQVAGRLIFYEHVVAIPSYSKGTLRRNKVAVGIVLHSPDGFRIGNHIIFIRSVQREGEFAGCQRRCSACQRLGALQNNLSITGIVGVDKREGTGGTVCRSQDAVAVITDADLDSVLCGVICNRRCTTSGLCQYKVVDSGFLEVVGLKGKAEVTLGIVFSCFYHSTIFQKSKSEFTGFQITSGQRLVSGDGQRLRLLCVIHIVNHYSAAVCYYLQFTCTIILNLDSNFIGIRIIRYATQSAGDFLYAIGKGLLHQAAHIRQGVGNGCECKGSISVVSGGSNLIAAGIQQLKGKFVGIQVTVFTGQHLGAADHSLCVGCCVGVGKGYRLGGGILEGVGSFQPAAHVYYSYNHVIDRIAIGDCSIIICICFCRLNLVDLIAVYTNLIEGQCIIKCNTCRVEVSCINYKVCTCSNFFIRSTIAVSISVFVDFKGKTISKTIS